MTSPLEVAYVELRPTGEKDFKKRVTKILDDTVKETDKKMKVVSASVEKSFDDAADSIKVSMDSATKSITITGQHIDRDLNDSIRRTRDEFKNMDRDGTKAFTRLRSVGARVSVVLDKVKDTIGSLFDRIRSGAGSGADALSSGLSSIGSSLFGLVTTGLNPAGLLSILTTLGAVVALAPLVLALAGALSQLIGIIAILPATAGVAVAAFAPLIVAFQGFGDAIGAIMEKDPDKIKEALDKLSPSARSVAKEFQKLFPQLERFQKLVQEAFFKPLVGDLTSVSGKLLPTLQTGFAKVANAFGTMISDMLGSVDGDIIEGIGNVFDTVVKVINSISPAAISLFETLFGAMEHGLPFVERLSVSLGVLIQKFADWLGEKLQTGEFESFLDNALRVFGELISLGTSLGDLLATIFSSGADEGESFIVTLTEAVQKLADFLKTADGQETLTNLFSVVKVLGSIVMGFAEALIWTSEKLNELDRWFDRVGDNLEKIPGWFDEAKQSVSDFFTDLGNTISGYGEAAIAWFEAIPGKIRTGLEAVPGIVNGVFTRVFDGVFTLIGQIAATIASFFVEVPNQIATWLSSLPALVGNIFTQMWDYISTVTVQKFTEFEAFLGTVPDRIRQALFSVINIVSGVFADATDRARAWIVNGFNAIVAFVGSVPSRIAAAFRSSGGFVSDVAGDLVGAVKSVINRAIDRINVGIATIDDILPGSLGRLPRLAKGAIARQPSITGEAGPEANIPLDDPRAVAFMRKVMGDDDRQAGTVVNIMPGAVQVTFAGAVPTERQARETGAAVVQGMGDEFDRRSTRAGVRSL